ncbi:hypothetical protein HQN90_22740 [Paenibacillus alba]|uniref:hypothetical protein n=1 Tax=Paenibacillus alba TaxID=1197127 RepID=UPI00156515D3|nr:hypothetical protein [Paenibacillus alba]NQX68950.1 hypothetical protein [Paenibacillus alba]
MDTYEGQINNPLSLNLYTYVENNPLTNIDPTGHVKGSVVDYLENLGEDSSFTNRANLAQQNGIVSDVSQYEGTTEQNTQLLDVLKSDFGDEYDDQYDNLYDENGRDAMRGGDAKKREKKQVDQALGKRGTKEREEKSKDLHDAKKNGRNDDNKGWDELKDGNYSNVDINDQPFIGPSYSPTLAPSNNNMVGTTAKAVGAGTIIYWIISEGTRLFPPRNLIPIP